MFSKHSYCMLMANICHFTVLLWHELHHNGHLSPSNKHTKCMYICRLCICCYHVDQASWYFLQIQSDLELEYWIFLELWWTHLDVLNAEFQHFIDSSADEVDIYTRQCSKHKLLRNLVDQRDTQAFLQVNQHLCMNTKKTSVSHRGTLKKKNSTQWR